MSEFWTPDGDARFRERVDGAGVPYADHWWLGVPSANVCAPEPSTLALPEMTVVSAEEFAAVSEPGAEPIIGTPNDVLIPRGGDAMVYGAGGAGKTTLTYDLCFHLAAPRDWLGFPIRHAVRVLTVENEGPRPLLRQKVARKLDAWPGPSPEGRLAFLEAPWAQFTFASGGWRAKLAATIRERGIDVLIAGPLTRVGMDSAGTLQEVAAFMQLIEHVRARCERLLTVILVHHESKGGGVSGAWEGASDTLLRVEARGNGFTTVHVEKARWSTSAHKTTLQLAWTDGEGFRLKEGLNLPERNLLAEIEALLSDSGCRTLDEIRQGVGAGKDSVRDMLAKHADRFLVRTGEDARTLGRSSRAKLYQVAT